ncbi:CBU_0585 family protein [Legionella yabuuchiae]|uniref:CBU_0585 family protein n=1 Tax=Legionella yabuuchiae TaxID=376727 RepID=UPI001054CD7B|nr:CBU_0585 family protein [Legionella yabuuchiae]
MSVQDIDKSYVSPIDKFLYKYDATHEKTQSQLKEIKKHERIANLRDNPEAGKQQDQIWQDF